MTKLPNNMSEETFFLLHISEFLGMEISEANKKLFENTLLKEEYKKKLESYKKMRRTRKNAALSDSWRNPSSNSKKSTSGTKLISPNLEVPGNQPGPWWRT